MWQKTFWIHFIVWKYLYFDLNFAEVCHEGSYWQWVYIGAGNCRIPNRWQAITRNTVANFCQVSNDENNKGHHHWPFLREIPCHDDVIKWNHFSCYWPFARGLHRSPVNSPHKGQWRGALMFSLICAWINGWVNNREAGDLRCHLADYDVTVM